VKLLKKCVGIVLVGFIVALVIYRPADKLTNDGDRQYNNVVSSVLIR